MAEQQPKPQQPDVLFADLSPENPTMSIESLCMNCHENGTTTFLLTTVPYFRQLIVSSFECPECGFKNNSVQFGGALQEKGIKYRLEVKTKADADRQVVKSDWATIKIPELDLEIPPESQKGALNTVEGVLRQTYDALMGLQDERRKTQPEQAKAIDAFCAKINTFAAVEKTFTLLLDDPSGNSFVENPAAPAADPNMTVDHYIRSEYQNAQLGLASEISGKFSDNVNSLRKGAKRNETIAILDKVIKPEDIQEVLMFPTHCASCAAQGQERMMRVEIPHFKEVVIMSFTCDQCGYKNNEIKSTNMIAPKGRRLCLLVRNQADLSRDLLKSDTAALYIPEIDLYVHPGSLGGRFTTIEGILLAIYDSFKNNSFLKGDSAEAASKSQWDQFLQGLQDIISLKKEFKLVVDDPVSNSYIQPLTDKPEDDVQLADEEYERTAEQNEELGLDMMNTDNYSTEATQESTPPAAAAATASVDAAPAPK